MRRGRTWFWLRMRPYRARKEGRAYALPLGPRRIASRICPDLISDRQQGAGNSVELLDDRPINLSVIEQRQIWTAGI
jgi:hypothetical protein